MKRELATAYNRMVQVANKKRRARTFAVGNSVFLKVKRGLWPTFSNTPMSKLSPKYFGPYTILARVGEVAYQLQLPTGVKVHLVFCVSLLKKTIGPNIATGSVLPPMEENLKVWWSLRPLWIGGLYIRVRHPLLKFW